MVENIENIESNEKEEEFSNEFDQYVSFLERKRNQVGHIIDK